MMIENNYYINVATQPTKNAAYGMHYCRIELGNCSWKEAEEKCGFIESRFPEDWNLTLHRVKCSEEMVIGLHD